jgi:type IV pilus assembly protein PilQ
MRKNMSMWIKRLGILFLFLATTGAWAAANPVLQDIHVTSLEGNRIQVKMDLTGGTATPKAFTIDSPSKLILDFDGVTNGLSAQKARSELNVGVVRRVSVVEAQNRTRVVFDLNETVPYSINTTNNSAYLVLAGAQLQKTHATGTKAFQAGKSKGKSDLVYSSGDLIKNIDFRRGSLGEGRIIVDLSNSRIPIDLKEEGTQIKVKFLNVILPKRLERKLDVVDFATPVEIVNTVQNGKDVDMTINVTGFSENIAYQADDRFTIEVRPLSKKEKDDLKAKSQRYTGEKLSLNFQDIEVRAVLQLIADFTGLNIVSSDTVRGNVTLRLRNVPWDQALDIILKTKGLAKRQVGNVMLIGPSEEIAAREKLELQTHQQVEELAPLRSEYIQVNYAKASDLAALLKDEKNSLLSARGAVSVDERTNILLVQDTAIKIDEVRSLVHKLDVPVRQVLIESRVVFANDDFEDALGVNFGAAAKFRPGNEPVLGFAGNRSASNTITTGNLSGTGAPVAPISTSVDDRLTVNLPVTLPGGGGATGFGLTLGALPGGTVLDLELQALESEGLGKIVASPRLVTSNQQQAYIESGEEIPYLESTSSGAASVSFKKAVLRLDVTPQITPDDHIILDLTVNQDSRGEVTNGVPAINTREMHTKVLVDNGETVVLGGIYIQEKSGAVRRVPFFGRLPYVGWMFKSEVNTDKRNELLIFVTPKIIQEGMA